MPELKSYDEIDRLVDSDTLALRDYALGLTRHIRDAQQVRAHHLRGTPPGMEDKCQCVGCEMGRALEGLPLLSPTVTVNRSGMTPVDHAQPQQNRPSENTLPVTEADAS